MTELYDNPMCGQVEDRKEAIPLKLIDWLPNKGKLLNVGCGKFIEEDEMLKMGLDIYGCDISKYAVRKVGNNEIKYCDVRERIPFDDNFFDVVYCTELIEHLGQTGKFFKEVARVMKTNGVLLLSTPLLNYWKFRLKILLGKDIFDDYHCRFLTIQSIKSNLKNAGFETIDYRVTGRLKIIRKSLCGHIFLKAIKK